AEILRVDVVAPAPALALCPEDVDPTVEDTTMEGDVVLLVLEREDRLAQRVVRHRGEIRCRRVVLVTGRVARPLEDRALECRRRVQGKRPGGDLVPKPRHAFPSKLVDPHVEAPSPLRY